MIVRELPDGSAVLIPQEGHADVAAQFAAHWGNPAFSRMDPYGPMVFATVYHDSGHREMEADVPIDGEKGLPYAFRGAPTAVRRREADGTNVHWIHGRDPYAGVVVAMHHAGLRKNRYNTVRALRPGSNGTAAPDGAGGLASAVGDLEPWQYAVSKQLELTSPTKAAAFWHNYRLLQVFDLLSLHLCCDGYEGDQIGKLTLEGVPVHYGIDPTVEMYLEPTGKNSVRFAPYPFDVSPLRISVMGRQMLPCVDQPDNVVQEAYHQAPRCTLTWEVSA
jgi:hypothetical protein